MKGVRAALLAAFVLGIGGTAAAEGPLALAKTGELYSVASFEDQVVITAQETDGTLSRLFVPQSASAIEDSLQVGVDEASGALYVVWQRNTGMDAKVRFAAYVDGTWIGPRTLGGNDGTAARHPQMLVHRASTAYVEELETGGQPIISTLETTFVHVVWWSQQFEGDSGSARSISIPVSEDGSPIFAQSEEWVLEDLLPYGAACFEIEAVDSLQHPKIFVDPQSGNPHVFLTDFIGCAFQVMELRPQVIDDDAVAKRRRQIIILRHAQTVTIRPDLPLARAKFAVGHNLAIVAFWDQDEASIDYIRMDRSGISDKRTLALSGALSHEQAVELIRGLTH
jgi:hypothetical protein